MGPVCIKYRGGSAPRNYSPRHPRLRNPGAEGAPCLGIAGLGPRISQLSFGAAVRLPPRPLSKLHPGAAGAAAAPHPSPQQHSRVMGGCVWGGYGGASSLQRRMLAFQHPDISLERKRESGGPRGGRGGLQSSAAEPCEGGGGAGAPVQRPGVWGLRDVRREQGGVTIQQRSGRTTEPSGGGGRTWSPRGAPAPPSQRPTTEVAGTIGRGLGGGSSALNPPPPQTPLPKGWAIEGWVGLERRRGGPSLAPPPTGLGRAQSVTLSLCRRSSAVFWAGATVAAAPVAALADAGAMAATDIARQVVSSGLGYQSRGQGPGQGRGDLAAADATARRGQ